MPLPTNLPEDVRALFGPGDDVHSRDPRYSNTPLLHVVREKRKDLPAAAAAVEALLQAGADVHAVDNMGYTALHRVYENVEWPYAYSPEESPLAKLLLAKGADREATDRLYGQTPLELSVGYRLTRYREEFSALKDGATGTADVNAIVDDMHEDTLLHSILFKHLYDDSFFAGGEFQADMAVLLIQEGADIFKKNADGLRPVDVVDKTLNMALNGTFVSDGTGQSSHFINCVQVIVEGVAPAMIARGADLNASEIGAKLLRIIVENFTGDNTEDMFEMHIDPLLQSLDVDWNYVTQDGNTALHDLFKRDMEYISYYDEDGEEDPEMFLVTAVRGVHVRSQSTLDLNATSGEGMTLLHYAAKLGYARVIHELCELGADVNMVTTSSGWTPLHVACSTETEFQLETAKALIQGGATVSTVTRDCGRTALHLASRSGKPQVISFLLSITDDIVAKDKAGLTALHYALELGSDNCVRSFFTSTQQESATLGKGAALIVPGGDTNQTPLHIAAERGYHRVVELILDQSGVDEQVIEAVDSDGRTALHLAAMRGHTGCVFLLLRRYPESCFMSTPSKRPPLP